MRIAICLALSLSVCACGGNKGTQPSDKPQSNGCFAVPNNYGGIQATISGSPAYSGITQKGAAFVGVGAGSVPGVVTVGAVDLKDGSQVIVSGPARLGTTNASLTGGDPATGMPSISFTTVKQDCSGPTGIWSGNATIGSASFTLTTLTSNTITGSFSGTLKPGTIGVGDKTISGTFSATF